MNMHAVNCRDGFIGDYDFRFFLLVYKDMRKVYWNNTLKNKTAIECRNILKYETESIIDLFH